MGKTMRKALFAATLVAVMGEGSSANAADLYASGSMKDAPVYTPVVSWTGFYLGGTLGYGWADGKIDSYTADTGAFLLGFNNRPEGVLGGFEGGYNWEVPPHVFSSTIPVVIGIEADVSATGQEDTTYQPRPSVPLDVSSLKQSIDWIETIRGRIGIPVGSVLPFFTGGAAFAQADGTNTQVSCGSTNCFSNNPPGTHEHFSSSLSGWVVGGGAEYAISANWSAKIEYLRIEFNQISVNAPAFNRVVKEDIADDVVRVGVNYRFNTVYESLKELLIAFQYHSPIIKTARKCAPFLAPD